MIVVRKDKFLSPNWDRRLSRMCVFIKMVNLFGKKIGYAKISSSLVGVGVSIWLTNQWLQKCNKLEASSMAHKVTSFIYKLNHFTFWQIIAKKLQNPALANIQLKICCDRWRWSNGAFNCFEPVWARICCDSSGKSWECCNSKKTEIF